MNERFISITFIKIRNWTNICNLVMIILSSSFVKLFYRKFAYFSLHLLMYKCIKIHGLWRKHTKFQNLEFSSR